MSQRKPFWERVDVSDPGVCWPWNGHRKPKGYGVLSSNAARRHELPTSAHRAAWTMTNGPIPDGMWVLHRCDNPPCCNPAHLFLGTHDDNMRDMVAKGRAVAGPGRPRRRHDAATNIQRDRDNGHHRPDRLDAIRARRYA